MKYLTITIIVVIAGFFIYLLQLLQLKHTSFISARPSLDHGVKFAEFLETSRQNTKDTITTAVNARTFLVIGGNGFTGGYLVEDLLQRGASRVRILSRKGRPSKLSSVAAHAAEKGQLVWEKGSMSDSAAVIKAVNGMEVVYLLAAHYGSPTFSRYGEWSDRKTKEVNIDGTKIVVEACQNSPTTKLLVYTSSSDVVFDRQDSVNRTEAETNYPKDPACHYLRTKGKGEEALLLANDPKGSNGGLTTVALRPSGIYGPGEDFFMPKVVEPGWMMKKIGLGAFFYFDKSHVSDMIFVYNLILAEELVLAKWVQDQNKNQPSIVGGNAYFITDGQAVNLAAWEAWQPVFSRLEIPLHHWLWIPSPILRFIATWSEWLLHKFREAGLFDAAPMLTEHEAWRATTTVHHSIDKAKEHFNYVPIVNTTVGMDWLGEEMVRRYENL